MQNTSIPALLPAFARRRSQRSNTLHRTVRLLVLLPALLLAAGRPLHAQNKTRAIDQLVKSYAQHHLFNGNVLVVQKDRVIFERSYGLADKEWNIPNTPYTKFRIGSLTKQFTALLILQLKQQGKISLQEKITTYLPWYPPDPGNKITVHHLLTHSSGLPNYTENADAVNDINTHAYTPEEVARKYCTGALQFEPGSRFTYNNSGYYLLGVIIEAVTQKPYTQVLKERVLDPAGMKNTGMDTPGQLLGKRAAGYSYGFDGYIHADYINAAAVTYAAGGLYATAGDLWLWEKALYGHKLLSPENTALMLTPNRGNYGYGLYISRTKLAGSDSTTVIGHNGSISGFSSSMLRYVDDETIVILLDNTRAEKRGTLENIIAGIMDILHGRQPRPPVQSIQVAMITRLKENNGEQLVDFYRKAKTEPAAYNFSGAAAFLNNFGYYLLQRERVKDALAVLQFATEEYPKSFYVWDTYAEALWKDGQKEKGIKMYRQSLELNPGNTNAAEKLKMAGINP